MRRRQAVSSWISAPLDVNGCQLSIGRSRIGPADHPFWVMYPAARRTMVNASTQEESSLGLTQQK
jgi:hypothetical protein